MDGSPLNSLDQIYGSFLHIYTQGDNKKLTVIAFFF